MGIVPRSTSDPARSTNITIKTSLLPVVRLIRADFERGLAEFLELCLIAYRDARVRERRKLTTVELELAITEARVKDANATIIAAETAREMDNIEVQRLQAELDKAREQIEKARRLDLSIEQVVDLAWGPPGDERRERLRRLAELHGHPVQSVMRAAGERHKREEAQRHQQANLRALPRGGRQ